MRLREAGFQAALIGEGLVTRADSVSAVRDLMPDNMQQDLFVKICGITNLEDARFAVRCGADAIGFIFHEDSPRFISHRRAAEIVQVLPEHISKIGVFVNADLKFDARLSGT